MGSLHSFDDRAVARLRQRLGAVEEANQDLLAFARGHHGAVDAIHRAVLLALQAGTFEDLLQIVTSAWPQTLGIDACVVAISDGIAGHLATAGSVDPINPALVRRTLRGQPSVSLRDVSRGHPFFGSKSGTIRAEALIRMDAPCGTLGLLLLGQSHSPGLQACGGEKLLRFLGQSLGAMLARWRTGTD